MPPQLLELDTPENYEISLVTGKARLSKLRSTPQVRLVITMLEGLVELPNRIFDSFSFTSSWSPCRVLTSFIVGVKY